LTVSSAILPPATPDRLLKIGGTLVLCELCGYMLLIGGIFDGVLNAVVRLTSVLSIALVCGIWTADKLQERARYHPTLITTIALVWSIAIALSWLANGAQSARSSTGAWFEALALLIMLLIADAIQRGLPRRWLFDALLAVGVIVLLQGYHELYNWLLNWQRMAGAGVPFVPVRPSGVFDNPNAHATVLIVLIPLVLARLFEAKRRVVRAGWALYALLLGFLLITTQSKGGWIGLAVGLIAMIALLLRSRAIQLSRRQIVGGLAIALTGLAVFVVIGLPLLSASARGDGRPAIYAAAIRAFLQSPFVGHGPDSFSLQLLNMQSIPPEPPHSHAHNMILHVAAELGLFGLAAAALMVASGVRAYQQALKQADAAERTLLIGAGSALIAYVGHGMFDVTASQPALLMLGAWLFAAAIAPKTAPTSTPLRSANRLLGGLVQGVLIGFVLIGGLWASFAYLTYYRAVANAAVGNYAQSAEALMQAAQADPYAPVKWAVAGYAEAIGGNLSQAITNYENALAIEPPNALYWENLAVLDMQANRADDAIHAAAQAVRYARNDAAVLINQGMILETFGQPDNARTAYLAALTLAPVLTDDNLWQQTALRRDVLAQIAKPPTAYQTLMTAINNRHLDVARTQIAHEKSLNPFRSQPYIDAALLEIRMNGDLNKAEQYLTAAQILYYPYTDSSAWLHYALGELAAARGDRAGRDRERQIARQSNTADRDGTLLLFGNNVPVATYFMAALPRTVLPQVWDPHEHAEILALLDAP